MEKIDGDNVVTVPSYSEYKLNSNCIKVDGRREKKGVVSGHFSVEQGLGLRHIL